MLLLTIGVILLFWAGCRPLTVSRLNPAPPESDTLFWQQVITDTLFASRQIISQLIIPKNSTRNTRLTFNYRDSDLLPTSYFAKERGALAAINGGFFDTKKGGSVTYFELNDTIISYSKVSESERKTDKYLFNGAIILTQDSGLRLQAALPEQIYEQSDQEAAVLITGPMLLSHSTKLTLPDRPFSNKRHPRTCLCTTEQDIIFLTIDGRSEQAAGMNLHEVQDFLLSLGCQDAINLDGGGSTTMWIQGKGVVNFPSDQTGERPVANALLIIKQ